MNEEEIEIQTLKDIKTIVNFSSEISNQKKLYLIKAVMADWYASLSEKNNDVKEFENE